MDNHSSISILASFATLKNLTDKKKYQSPYQLLQEFIKYIIVSDKICIFTAIEMKNRLSETFGFVIPEAVIKTTSKKLPFVKIEQGVFYVNQKDINTDYMFKDLLTKADSDNFKLYESLLSFVKDKMPSKEIDERQLTHEFISFVIDEPTSSNNYLKLISEFVLKNENDKKIQEELATIREGSILYIGLTNNISETGSLSKKLTLFLDTEVLFSLLGYNGEIYEQLTMDLFEQIKIANKSQKPIQLKYFSDVQREIERFFGSAKSIVDGKIDDMYNKVAMKAITNKCKTSGDVEVECSDFFYKLQYQFGIMQDDRKDYYDESNNENNLESLSESEELYESIKFVSHINKLRNGAIFQNNIESEYLLVTNTNNTLKVSNKKKEQIKRDNNLEHVCDFAVSVDKMTNILWYKLGNGFGQKDAPINVNAVYKARTLLSSYISHDIIKVYSEAKVDCASGKITEKQLAARIITLKSKRTLPEELDGESIEEDLNFSVEYITRYEEEVKQNKQELDEAHTTIRQRDKQIAQKNEEIQSGKEREKKLAEELALYKKRDEEQVKKKDEIAKKKDKLKRIGKFILIRLFIFVLVFILACIIYKYFDANFIGILLGIADIGLFLFEVVNGVHKEFNNQDKQKDN